MPEKKESLTDQINAAISEAFKQRDDAAASERQKKDDPAGWLENTIRKVVREEIDRPKAEEPRERAPRQEEEKSFFDKFVGGGS